MANAKESESRAADIIKNWIRNRYTIEFLGTWEMIHNPNLKWSNSTTLKLGRITEFCPECFGMDRQNRRYRPCR